MIPNKQPFRKEVPGAVHGSDASLNEFGTLSMPSPLISFDGLSSNDNAAAFGFRVVPPDTNGDVGPNHYVQAVNTLFRIFDKNGNALTPPLKLSSLFESLGTACATRDDGDPIVLYDGLSDRWLISQFCKNVPPFRQMIALSKTGDPTGEYYVWEFVMPNVKLNDYPKFGFWHDALYMSTDEFFGGDYAGSGAFAFDIKQMIQGNPNAGYVYFDLASPTTMRIGGILPVDLDGTNAPPASSPGLFVGYMANEYGDPVDALRIFEFRPNFEDVFSSTFAEAAFSPLGTSEFDPTSPVGRNDIEQPSPGERLDSQSDRLMYRASYRNFGSNESIVVSSTVRTTPLSETYRAGIRVWELNRPIGGVFGFRVESTLGTNDTSRFMGAAALDHVGNLALSYTTSNEDKQPSIIYSGRTIGDPAGTFRVEGTLVEGTGVQTAFGFRWGDYSALSVDPADGCTFWSTNQYYSLASQNESAFGWLTRIGAFRFPECDPKEFGELRINVVNDETDAPVEGALLEVFPNTDENLVSFKRVTKANGTADAVRIDGGTHRVEVSLPGFETGTEDIAVTNGGVTDLTVRLNPAPYIQSAGVTIATEDCKKNGSAEPGEFVSINVPLRNTGQEMTSDLIVTLSPNPSLENVSGPQNYGILPNDGNAVVRQFSFKVRESVSCGDKIELVFTLSDPGVNLPNLRVDVQTGLENIVLSEDFESVVAPALPSGWTSTFEGEREEWTTSTENPFGGENAAFSPDPRTTGVNQLISPSIPITQNDAQVRFKNWYELETTFLRNRVYDGAVLEIQIGDEDWKDIEEAGGFFIEGGYNDGVIDACCDNPLVGRRAWSGRSGIDADPVYIDSRAQLPATAAGNNIRLRWRVATDRGTFRDGMFIDDIEVVDGFRCDCSISNSGSAPFDFDGDGKTDLGTFLPRDESTVPDFRIIRSSDSSLLEVPWGSSGDVAVNEDFDGDGKTDIAVFRPVGGVWFVLQSSDSLFNVFQFGSEGDIPTPGDFDGDGKADAAVYRPSEGVWYVLRSTNSDAAIIRFGVSEDLPVASDFDGDGKTDIALFRPSDGVWYTLRSSDNGFEAVRFGAAGDRPVPGDFDGDGKSDRVVFRPSDQNWYILGSTSGFSGVRFGLSDDIPLQADFDGDGKLDVSVFRPSENAWYSIQSTNGNVSVRFFGVSPEIPIPSVYVR